MGNVFVYIIDLPPNVSEMVVPCFDGYTVYLDAKLSQRGKIEAYRHALRHIERDDWNNTDVQHIERKNHPSCW